MIFDDGDDWFIKGSDRKSILGNIYVDMMGPIPIYPIPAAQVGTIMLLECHIGIICLSG